jgi:hypothetical protein
MRQNGLRPFKQFLLDNFSIQYVVRSNAEHWFKNSQVSTIFITLRRGKSDAPTRFVTLNFKLEEKLVDNINENLHFIEDFYTQIDYCDNQSNQGWQQNEHYKTVFSNVDNTVKVSLVSHARLMQSLVSNENWAQFFISENPLLIFNDKLINPQGIVFTNGRGTKTCYDKFHIINEKILKSYAIDKRFLIPVLQNSQDLVSIRYNLAGKDFLFICSEGLDVLELKYSMTFKWIMDWSTKRNQKGMLLPEKFIKNDRRKIWYYLKPEAPANIFISINPDKKLFFSYSPEPIHLNQRLVAIRTKGEDVEIITALLNSIVSLLIVELNGISRNLGALDLNADFFKTKMKILNPALLTPKSREEILAKFTPLSIRAIEQYDKEFKKEDRIAFDQTILNAYGYDIAILPDLYNLLMETINNRVNMKNR